MRARRSVDRAWRLFLEPLEVRRLLATDFGDAPDTGIGTGLSNYNTLAADNGPSHTIVPGLFMGNTIDGEGDALPNATATGDNQNQLPNDEDGLKNAGDLALFVGHAPVVRVVVTNTTGAPATLWGWIDYNQNGRFETSFGESAQATVASGAGTTTVTLAFPPVPQGFAGTTFARFRLSTDAAASNPTGLAADGEVEDHATITTTPNGAVVGSFTMSTATPPNDFSLGIVTSLGDVNGDGINDIAIGSSIDSLDFEYAGAVHILFLNANGTVKSQRRIAHEVNGGPSLEYQDYFGSSVAGIGDLNLDGVPDLVVGARGDDDRGVSAGAVYVLFLDASGVAVGQQKILSPANNFQQFGRAVGVLPDLNGDGVPELAVGNNDDEVYIHFMNRDGTIKQLVTHTLLNGLDGIDSLASIGDLDLDGLPELAVGSIEGQFRGSVDVLFMNSDGTFRHRTQIDHNSSGGPPNILSFGSGIAPLGDIDSDGVPDIAIGDVSDELATERGAVYMMLMNANGTVKRHWKITHQLHGGPTLATNFAHFGSSLASLGDLNGDGTSDLVVMSRQSGIGGAAFALMMSPAIDYGDAIDSGNGVGAANYRTVATDDGARHAVTPRLKLGANVDGDSGTLQNAAANADDTSLAPDDEDGIVDPLDLTLIIGERPTVDLKVTNTTPVDATLWGWIDYNANGIFESGSESAQATVVAGADDATVTLTFPFVPGNYAGTTYARFRLSTDPLAANPTGFATDGEVEDYVASIVSSSSPNDDFGDAPDAAPGTAPGEYQTTAIDNGPRHGFMPGLLMGAFWDGDSSFLNNTKATADDENQALPDDEDGLNNPAIDLMLTVGTQPSVNVIVTNRLGSAATLSGWIDYNRDGVFDNATERAQAVVGVNTISGIATLTFPQVPIGSAGKTYARFRLSTDAAAANPFGPAADGEVEDYSVVIYKPTFGGASGNVKIADNAGGGPSLTNGARFGSAVAPLGDLDGDGVPDLAVGAEATILGGAADGKGAVYILFMNANGTVKSFRKIASQTNGGPTVLDYNGFGHSLVNLGDLDADGVTDLGVGYANRMFVLFLRTDGTVRNWRENLEPRGSLTSLGDLNGDGVVDIASNGPTGGVLISFLNSDGTVKRTQTINHSINGGPDFTPGGTFGYWMSAIGDLDGDGVTDMAVGGARDTGSDTDGGFYVFFLQRDGSVRNWNWVGDQGGGGTNTTWMGGFGSSGFPIGDLNGDGVPDLAVGSQGDDSVSAISDGVVYFLMMNSDGSIQSFQRIAHETNGGPTLGYNSGFGHTVALIGDLNGDSLPDFAVGAFDDDTGGSERGALYTSFLTQLTVHSIFRHTPATTPTTADQVTFRVTFVTDVQNVSADDFRLSGTAAADGTIFAPVQVSPSIYEVTVTGLTNSNGTINLDFAATNNIQNLIGVPLGSAPSIGSEQEFTIDNIAPGIVSFTRQTPSTILTNADTLIFRITFSEPVAGVDAADFAVAGSSATVTNVSPNSTTAYLVTVSGGDLATLNGVVGLDLGAAATVTDIAGNALPIAEPVTDETYTLDNALPGITSFTRRAPTSESTNADFLVFRVTFDEPVTGVDTTDFAANGPVAGVSSVQLVTTTTYDVTVSGGTLPTFNGTVGLNRSAVANISDLAGNLLPVGEPPIDETYTLDNLPPNLLSFVRRTPTAAVTNADSLLFRVTFDEDVLNVNTADFAVFGGSTAIISNVTSISPGVYDVTASGGNLAGFTGTVGLNLRPTHNISDSIGNLIANAEPPTDETYFLDNDPPGIQSFSRFTPSANLTNADVLVFRAVFDENVTGVDAADFAVNGTTSATVTGVQSISGTVYDVTVSGGDLAGFNGFVGLNFSATVTVSDEVGNVLPATEPTLDQVYELENVPPALVSFVRLSPNIERTSADQLVFRVTFNESVTGVGVADFVHSGATTGGVSDVAQVTPATYDVTISGGDLAVANTTIGLNLSATAAITDLAGNALPILEPAIDETYEVDNDPPGLVSFSRQSPTSSPTNADSLVFRIVFDENVMGVDAGDFVVTGTTAPITNFVQLLPTTYDLTISGGNLANLNATVGLNLSAGRTISDLTGNSLPLGEPATDMTFVVDNDAPSVTSFRVHNPIASPTNADTLIFRVLFDEDVTGVEIADFRVNGTTTGSVTNVTPVSAMTYDVTVSGGDLPGFTGVVGLNFDAAANIVDPAGNALPTGEPTIDQTFTLDNDAPDLVSIARLTPLAAITNQNTLVFRILFDESVTSVDTNDFVVVGTTATISNLVRVNGTTYEATLSGGDLANLNGIVGLNVAGVPTIADLATNPLPTGEPEIDETFTVDNDAPGITSFTRQSPSVATTNADTLTLRVLFDEAVMGIGANDFQVTGTSTATITDISEVNVGTYDIVLSGGNLAGFNGSIGLDFSATASVTDLVGNAFVVTEPSTDESYLLDNVRPGILGFTRQSPIVSLTNANTLVFRATFDEPVIGVDENDFSVLGTTTAGVSNVAQISPTAYDVTVAGGNLASFTGTVGLNLSAIQNIRDASDNSLPVGEPTTDEVYTLDNSPPILVSFARQSPTASLTSADALVFRVTLDVSVTDVDAADFAVAGSTTATIGNVSQVTPASFDVTISSGDLANFNGSVGLNLAATANIRDLAGNPLPIAEPATDELYILDNDPPGLTSFTRLTPTSADTNADTLSFRVLFDENVTAVDTSDFSVQGTTTATVTNVNQVAPKTYHVTISGGNLANFNGQVGLNLAAANNITDPAGNALPATEPAIDETFTLDNLAPTLVSITRQNPLGNATNSDTLLFRVTFDDDVVAIDASDFVAAGGTTAAVSNLTSITARVYDVLVSGGNLAGFNGIVGLNLNATQNLRDAVGNNLPTVEPATDQTYTLDNDPPGIVSFTRLSPTASPTNADSLTFRVVFDEEVASVDQGDFSVGGTTTAVVSNVVRLSATNYDVTVSGGDLADFNGLVGLNLRATHDISDLVVNPLPVDEPAIDETFAVDNLSPTLVSISLQNPVSSLTNADSLVFRISFSEATSNVDAADFAVSGGSSASVVTLAQNTATTYDVTVSGGNLANFTGAVGLDLRATSDITDRGGNLLPVIEPSVDEAYALDNELPVVTSIVRQSPQTSSTNADTLVFRVLFSENVTGVEATDFSAAGIAAAVAQVTPISANTFDVTLSGAALSTFNGVVGLDLLAGASIADSANNQLSGEEPATDETYLLDNDAPEIISIQRRTPLSSVTNEDVLVFRVMFDEDVQSVSASDFAVEGATTATIASLVQVTPTTYDVTISGGNLATFEGTVGLNLRNSHDISDLVGNSLPVAEPTTDETYVLDNQAPMLLAFARQSPTESATNADVLVIRATFDEAVSEVDATDFTVATSSTAGVSNVAQVNPTTFDLTISGGNLANFNGTIGLDLSGTENIRDAAGNSLVRVEPATDETYTLDNDRPGVVSIVRQSPTNQATNSDSLVFRVSFDENVSGVDATDFATTGAAATVSNVASVSNTTFDVTVSGASLATLNGIVGLSIRVAASISDLVGNALDIAAPAINETYLLDNDAPDILSILRQTPATALTNQDVLVFRVAFSEDVQGVDGTDFAVQGSTATISNVLQITPSSWDVTVSGGNLSSINGTVGLNLNGTQNITDLVGNLLPTAEPATDETYTLDNTAPAPIAFTRRNPTTNLANADAVVIRAKFDENVFEVDASDFTVNSLSTATITNVAQVNQTTYDLTISGGNLANFNGTVGLNFNSTQNIRDATGNALVAGEPATDETYLLDNATPSAVSILRQSPASSLTNADSLVFRVTFSEDVVGVDVIDFVTSGSMTAGITSVVQMTPSTYDVTVSGGNLASGNGNVGLDFTATQNISDVVGNPLPTGEPATDETYQIDNDSPGLVSFTRETPAASPTNADTLVFAIRFDELVDGVDPTDFVVAGASTAVINITQVAPLVYHATLSGAALANLNGTVGIDLRATHNITDQAGNRLPSLEPATDETFILDNDPPGLISITRQNPTTGSTSLDTLVFRVTFDEDVSEVGAADFVVNGTTIANVTAVATVSARIYDVTVHGDNLAATSPTIGLDLRTTQDVKDLVGNPLPTIEPPVDETFQVVSAVEVDFGDAPTSFQSGFAASYPTLLAADGARHVVGDLMLGATIDSESNGQPDADAGQGGSGGDDNTAVADEDGVELIASIVANGTVPSTASLLVIASDAGLLDGWIDFNRDGDWQDEGEQIFDSTSLTAGNNVLPFEVPAAARPGATGARFRLSSTGGLLPTGLAADGEVEDYFVTILDGTNGSQVTSNVTLPVAGELRIQLEGNEVVATAGTIELFRSITSAIREIHILGTHGDDTIQLGNLAALTANTHVDGRGGSNTLQLTQAGQTLDLTTLIDAALQNIDAIDIVGSGNNTLTLNLQEVLNLSTASDTLDVIANPGDKVNLGNGWKLASTIVGQPNFIRVLTQGAATLRLAGPYDWNNPLQAPDVNGSGSVEPQDALVIINELNGRRFSSTTGTLVRAAGLDRFPGFYDVSPDGLVVPFDVLAVINFLNSRLNAAEGEMARGDLEGLPTEVIFVAAGSQADGPIEPDRCLQMATIGRNRVEKSSSRVDCVSSPDPRGYDPSSVHGPSMVALGDPTYESLAPTDNLFATIDDWLDDPGCDAWME